MDAFYVSIELARRPELVGRPVVVGAAGPRGVVAAASYEARRYGVRSAMASVQAARLCPGAVFLPGDHAHYATVSARVHDVLARFTPLVEPIALDEAFLDVTAPARRLARRRELGERLREAVRVELALPCSVGVASNKLLAKLASEAAKPIADVRGVRPGPGVVEVAAGEELAFLHPHPVQALWGVGPATLERLARLGVVTVGDLAALPLGTVVRALGKAAGTHLHRLAHGDDDRPVAPDRALKSVGHEETFLHDRHGVDELHPELLRLADSVAGRLRASALAGRTVSVKVRFADFRTVTRSVTVGHPVELAGDIVGCARPLVAGLDLTGGVRLLGVSVTHLVPHSRQRAEQLRLGLDDGDAPPPRADWSSAAEALDAIRRRFGDDAIASATAAFARTRASQWGPQWQPEAGADAHHADPSDR